MISSNQLQIASEQGRRRWLQKFLMSRLSKLEKAEVDYQAWFDSFIQLMNSRGLVLPTQQKDYLSDVRNAIRVLDPNHPALSVVKFDRETWIEINNYYSDNIAQRTTKFLANPDAIVRRATVLLGSYAWAEIAAGLAVVTGRRCTEVIKTARFEHKTKYSLMFAGSLKRRGEPIECVFEIPTLCQAELVLSAIAVLRKKLGGQVNKLSKRQINRRFGKAVSRQCQRHFSDLVPPRDDKDNLYTHLFRAVYATIASYWYCPQDVPEMEFRAAIQGHYQIIDENNPQLRRSLAASRNYFDYKISDGQGNVDGRLGIKLDLPSVTVVEQFLSYIRPPQLSGLSQTSGIEPPSRTVASTTEHEYQPHPFKFPAFKTDSPKPKKLIMNQANSTQTMAIPSFLHSRLSAISNQLGLSKSETIEELFKWTEVGISLANELGSELNPNAVFNLVQQSIEDASVADVNRRAKNKPDDSIELATAKQQIATLIDSQLSMSRTIEKLAAATVNSREVSSNYFHHNSSNRKSQPVEDTSYKPTESAASLNSTATNKAMTFDSSKETKLDKTPFKRQSSQPIRTTVRRRDSSDTVAKDINHALDAIIEFNDAPERPYNQKFYIGVGSLKELTNRGDVAIRKILEEREDEILAHLDQHQLDQNHNLSRRDDKGDEYPKIYQEPAINYHKITHVV